MSNANESVMVVNIVDTEVQVGIHDYMLIKLYEQVLSFGGR